MFAIYDKKSNKISKIVDTSFDNIDTMMSKDEGCVSYPISANIVVGYDIRVYDDLGNLKSVEQLVRDDLLSLDYLEILESKLSIEMRDHYESSIEFVNLNKLFVQVQKNISKSGGVLKHTAEAKKEEKPSTLDEERRTAMSLDNDTQNSKVDTKQGIVKIDKGTIIYNDNGTIEFISNLLVDGEEVELPRDFEINELGFIKGFISVSRYSELNDSVDVSGNNFTVTMTKDYKFVVNKGKKSGSGDRAVVYIKGIREVL